MQLNLLQVLVVVALSHGTGLVDGGEAKKSKTADAKFYKICVMGFVSTVFGGICDSGQATVPFVRVGSADSLDPLAPPADMCAALLAHVNLLLTLYGGAALASAARLKWDPSTYVVLRELFPAEYRAAAAALAAGGAALLLLPHVAAAAMHAARQRARALLLYLYAALLTLLMVGQLVFGGWLAAQALAWQRSAAAQQLGEALALSEHLRPVLQYFARWHPMPRRIEELVEEAREDAPRNAYAALGLLALLALLQLTAVVAALLAARADRVRPRAASLADSESEMPLQPRPPSYNSSSSYDYQKMPRTAYRNGRIVILGPPRP